jgi:hypothetical protein
VVLLVLVFMCHLFLGCVFVGFVVWFVLFGRQPARPKNTEHPKQTNHIQTNTIINTTTKTTTTL